MSLDIVINPRHQKIGKRTNNLNHANRTKYLRIKRGNESHESNSEKKKKF